MPTKGRPIVIIDRYTWAEIARYPSVKAAAKDLAIPFNTIYQCLFSKVPSYDAYFIYEDEFDHWVPVRTAFKRVRGLKISTRLEELRKRRLTDNENRTD